MRLDAITTIALGLAIGLVLCGPVYGCPMTAVRFLAVCALLYVFGLCVLIAFCRGVCASQSEEAQTKPQDDEAGERVPMEAWA